MDKISWPAYALHLAYTASRRSSDPYIKVGAAILRHDNSVASLGYNGPPSGREIDWSDRDERRKRIIHAECNALRYVKPGECYLLATTLSPCGDCVKQVAAYGIKEIYYNQLYKNDMFGIELAKEFGINVVQIEDACILDVYAPIVDDYI